MPDPFLGLHAGKKNLVAARFPVRAERELTSQQAQLKSQPIASERT